MKKIYKDEIEGTYLESEFFELPETRLGFVNKKDGYIVININNKQQFLVGYSDVKTQANGKISLRIKKERLDGSKKEYKVNKKIDNNYKNDKKEILSADEMIKLLKQNGFNVSKFKVKDLLAKAGEK